MEAAHFVLKIMTHNVQIVYDIFAVRIRALRSKDQVWQNAPEQWSLRRPRAFRPEA
jgi:hypothetical protein